MDALLIYQIACIIFACIFGLIIGSFLNVCIYRIPEGRTIVKGHSMCMSCGHTLGPLDLVPLLSWVFLKGKCRYCGAPIASRYAKIEGLTGLVFAVLAWVFRSVFVLQGDTVQDIFSQRNIPFARLVILFALAAVIIVAMMIQKDHKTGMYRLSVCVLVLLSARFLLDAFDTNAILPALLSALWALLLSAGILLLLVIFTPLFRSPHTFVKGFAKGAFIKDYFADSNRPVRTTDLFFAAVCTSIGLPAAFPCLIIYAAARAVPKQERLLPFLGIIIASAAFAGVIIFRGSVF
jgi:prepilin signal peptidase PulO-like enzyme (type II secretory pathway)